jgi:hypothetical protein
LRLLKALDGLVNGQKPKGIQMRRMNMDGNCFCRRNEIFERSVLYRISIVAVFLCGVGAMTSSAIAQCNCPIDQTTLTPPSIGSAYLVGDTVRVRLRVGGGSIAPTDLASVPSVSFALDCKGPFPVLETCVDEGPTVRYLGDVAGNLTTDCPGVTVASNLVGGGTLPNIVVFTFTPALQLPNALACNVDFDTRIEQEPIDPPPGTPTQIETVSVLFATCSPTDITARGGGSDARLVLFCDDNTVNRNTCTGDTTNPLTTCVTNADCAAAGGTCNIEETCDGTAAGPYGCSAEGSGALDACRAGTDECLLRRQFVQDSDETCDRAAEASNVNAMRQAA